MSKFILIEGGKKNTWTAHHAVKKISFRRIHLTMKQAECGDFGPATGLAIRTFAAVAGGTFAIVKALEHWAILPALPSSMWWDVAIVGFIAAALTYKITPHKTWSSKIYSQLAAYEPVNLAAFADFQNSIENYGLTIDVMNEWCDAESAAIFEIKENPCQ